MHTALFRITEVSQRLRDSGNAWLEFLDVPTLSMGVYSIPTGTDDRETHDPHDRDEVYVGLTGQGRLTADGEEFNVESGVVVYVKAGVVHYFHDVTEDLSLLVFFAGPENEATDR